MRHEMLNFPNGNEGLLRESAEDFRKAPIAQLFVELSQTVQRGSRQPTEKEWHELYLLFQERNPDHWQRLAGSRLNRNQYRVALLTILGLRPKQIMVLMGFRSQQQVSNIKRMVKKKIIPISM